MSEAETIEHAQLMNDYVALWNGDASKLDVVAESVVVQDPGIPEGEVHGRDALEAHIEDLRTGFPDFHVTLRTMLEQEGVVLGEWTATGTHDGEFNDMPPTGREMELHGMDKIVVADGEIREHHIYYDVLGMLEQLGLAEQ